MSRLARLAAIGASLSLAVVLGLTVARPAPAEAAPHGHGAQGDRAALHDQMRKLWEDHITWTRLFIVSAATLDGDVLPDIDATTNRLLANQADIGNALEPFYGEAAGDAVTELLTEHILTAAQLVTAAKAEDAAGVAAASTAWYANADEIAAALHALNPRFWALDDLRTMMRAHLDRTLEEALARLDGRYADDVAAYEAIHADILHMADMLSDGIIRQFPGRFGG